MRVKLGIPMLMLLPQSLRNQQVTIDYTIDGEKKQPIEATITAGEWVNNTIYHYYLTLDLSQDLGKPIIIGDPTVIEWEKELIENLDPPVSGALHVEVPDAIEGINGNEGNNRFTVIKPNVSKQSVEFSLLSPGGDVLSWKAEIVAYEGQPTNWLNIATSADGSGGVNSCTGNTDQRLYVYIPQMQASDATQNRTALIKITPIDGDDKTPRYISVTQEPGVDIRYVKDSDGERYDIYTAKGLSLFSDWINSNQARTDNANLINNINLSAYSWRPIGINTRPYSGVFYGHGKTLSGMKIKEANPGNGCGLFGNIQLGLVMDLTLDGAIINASGHENFEVGTIAGSIQNGAMINCLSKNFYINTSGIIGGLVGSYKMFSNQGNNQPKSIIACAATDGIIELNANYKGSAVGGVVGNNLGSLVFCSYSRSNKIINKSTTTKVSIGGVVGINNTYFPSQNAYVSSSVVTDCYSNTEIISENSQSIVGSIVGSQIRKYGIPMVTYCASNYSEGIGGVGQNHVDGIVRNTAIGASLDEIWTTIHNNDQQIYLERLPDGKGGLLSLGQMWKRKTSTDFPILHWEDFVY